MRKEREIRNIIKDMEIDYPPGKIVYGDPIGNYNLGVLAGLKVALGEYPSFVEMNMEEFFKSNFVCAEEMQ